MTRIKGPVEALNEVLRLVSHGEVRFTRTSRDDLAAAFTTAKNGKAKALAILGALTPDDYDHSVRLPNPPADCDVYGIQLDDVQWYIKFYTDVDVDPPHDGFLQVVSFHKERSTFTLEARRKLVLQ